MDAAQHKYQNVVFWGVDAVDKVQELKQGAQVSVSGDRVVRQVEGKDGQMRVFSEIHRGNLTIEKQPREKIPGVPIEMKGEVLYDPELRALPGNAGKYYAVLTIRPNDGSDKVRAPFYGHKAMEIARSMRKGSEVSIKGELIEREYTTREGMQVKGLEIQKAILPSLEVARGKESPEAIRPQAAEEGLGR